MKDAYFITVKRPNNLQEDVFQVYKAIKKLPSGKRFVGRSIIKDLLKALNEVQCDIYFHPSPQSKKERERFVSYAKRVNKKPNDGQLYFWMLTISVRNPQIARDPQYRIEEKTRNEVKETSPKDGVLLLVYNQTAYKKPRQRPIFIERL